LNAIISKSCFSKSAFAVTAIAQELFDRSSSFFFKLFGMIVPSSWTIQFLCANFDFADQNFLIKFLELEKSTFRKNRYCMQKKTNILENNRSRTGNITILIKIFWLFQLTCWTSIVVTASRYKKKGSERIAITS